MSVGLTLQDLVAGYGATVVIDGISLSVRPGGTLAILGRNGVGKTTLLATLMGLTTLHGGAVLLGEERIEGLATYHRARLGLGYVPQEREIFPSLTTEENLAVSVLPGGWAIELQAMRLLTYKAAARAAAVASAEAGSRWRNVVSARNRPAGAAASIRTPRPSTRNR